MNKFVNENIEDILKPKDENELEKHYFVYNIKKEEDEYTFDVNKKDIIELIKTNNFGINHNEIARFMAFTVTDIYNKIPISYLEDNELYKIHQFIKIKIEVTSKYWMELNSDDSMRKGMDNAR